MSKVKDVYPDALESWSQVDRGKLLSDDGFLAHNSSKGRAIIMIPLRIAPLGPISANMSEQGRKLASLLRASKVEEVDTHIPWWEGMGVERIMLNDFLDKFEQIGITINDYTQE
jgi:hypothetical protein